MKTLGSRIAHYRKLAGLSQAALAEKCGWASQSRVGNYEKDTREPTLGDLEKIANSLGVSISQLASGDDAEIANIAQAAPRAPASTGEAALAGQREDTPNHPELLPISVWDDETPLDDDEVEVPFLREVELSAGQGRTAIQESDAFKLRFGKRSLRKYGVQTSNAVCVTVKGNSMEPVLRTGATIGVDRGKREIIDGDLYAISHGGQLRVKQVYRLPGGGIRLRSFNRDEHPDEEYSFDAMREQGIEIIGRVFWSAMFH